MARFSSQNVSDRLQAARASQSGQVLDVQSSVVAEQQTSSSSVSLRRQGRDFVGQEKALSGYQSRIATIKAAIAKRESEGKSDASTYRREELARYEGYYDAALAEYQQRRGAIGEQAYGAAIQAAPKNFRTDRLNQNKYTDSQGNYVPPNAVNSIYDGSGASRGYTGIKGAAADPRSGLQGSNPAGVFSIRSVSQSEQFDRRQSQLAGQSPGIYRLSDGSAIVSSSSDGSFVARGGQRNGATVQIRTPIGSKVGGGFLYAPSGNRSSFGIDLFDPSNQAAIRSSAGEFGTVGALFNSAQPEKTYKPANASYNNGSVSLSGNGRRLAFLDNSDKESPRLQALQGASDFVSRYQVSSDKRIADYDTTLSYLSFGGGLTGGALGIGKTGKTAAAVVTGPVYGIFAFADRTFLAAQKSFLYTGALITPETRGPAIQELKGTLPVIRETLTDPYTVIPAVLAGGALGYSKYNVARRTPATISFVADSAVVSDVSVTGGAVTGSGRLIGSAEVSYRYGPAQLFSRTEVVPAEGSVVFSGLRQAGRGSNYLVSAEGVGSTAIKGKSYFSDVSYRGVYAARSGELALTDGSQVFLSRSGRGVARPVGLRSAPGRSYNLEPNSLGQLRVTGETTSRGLVDAGRVDRYSFQPSAEGVSVGRLSDFNNPAVIRFSSGDEFGTLSRSSSGRLSQGSHVVPSDSLGFAVLNDKGEVGTNVAFLRNDAGKGTFLHESGHKFVNSFESSTFERQFFGGVKQSEIVGLQRKGLVKGDAFFSQYPSKYRLSEVFAESYKARELDPVGFRALAPELSRRFDRVDPGYVAHVSTSDVAGLRPVGSRYLGEVEQFGRSRPTQGASLRLVDRGLARLSRAGYYDQPSVEIRPTFGDRFRSLASSRKGSLGSSEQILIGPETVTAPRQLPQSSVFNPRSPSFAGLDLGTVRGRTSQGFSSLLFLGSLGAQKSLSDSREAFAQRNSQVLRYRQVQRPEQRPQLSYDLVPLQVPKQRPELKQEPILSYRQTPSLIAVQDLVPRSTPFNPPSARPRTPPPLIPPPGGFSFGGPEYRSGRGQRSPNNARRGYGFTRSLIEIEFGLGGGAPILPRGGRYTGLEVVRTKNLPRKRRSRA